MKQNQKRNRKNSRQPAQIMELLAPAGSYESLVAALGAGADAVYVGGSAFGARAYARNFDQEELLRAIDLVHVQGKKLYLTVNTLMKEAELEGSLYTYLLPFYKEGLDAVIVQDLGAVRLIRECFPDLPVHASTQMTITGPESMKLMEKLGLTRVVPAREMSLQELKIMHEESPLELETFVHGAMCYSYSGQCLMSSFLGGRSGNRGRCAQPCRLPYNGEEKHLLSMKDMNTLSILPEIMEAGVMSLKIEGRMKQPSYTAGVTGMYRKYLDKLLEKGPQAYRVDPKDAARLLEVFSRGGSCTGYYEMHNAPSMMDFSNAKKTAEPDVELKEPRRRIDGELYITEGADSILTVHTRAGALNEGSLEEVFGSASGAKAQQAKRCPMDEAQIRSRMEKLGGTGFEWGQLEVQVEGEVFIPVSDLNALRREALASLEESLKKTYRREEKKLETDRTPWSVNRKKSPREIRLTACVETLEQAKAVLKEGLSVLYAPMDVICSLLEADAPSKYPGTELYLALPHISRGGRWRHGETLKDFLSRGVQGFLVRSLEDYAALVREGLGDRIVTDHSLYTWNREAQRFFLEQGCRYMTLPLELSQRELEDRCNEGDEMIIYGYLPMMHSAQCVRKNTIGCNHGEDTVYLTDRKKKRFPVRCYCYPWKDETTGHVQKCYNIIYNTLPYGLVKEAEEAAALGISSGRLSFTVEGAEQTRQIIQAFKAAWWDNAASAPENYTKGHFKKGAL